MPVHAQYQTMGAKTSIDDLLDLNEQLHYQKNNRHIRPTVPSRPEGIYSVRPDNMSHQQPAYIQQNQQVINHQQNMKTHDDMVENYENISIESVANNIFPSSASYIKALDDVDNPLHGVAMSLLGNGNPNCDKTVYIIIIIILAIAIACLLYKMSKN
jgi:hypothetical protein